MDTLPAILIVLALIITSGVFSLFDYALAACRKTRLEKEKISPSILKTYENPKKLSLACRLWINILRICAAFFSGIFVMQHLPVNADFSTTAIIMAVSVLVIGLAAALFGDALPKLISHAAPEKIVIFLFAPIRILSFPMMPFILPALKIASLLRTALKIEEDDKSFTEDELRQALMEGEKSGVVESKERIMVEGVLYLGDRPVSAFMTHRSEIQLLDFNDSYEEIKEKALEYRNQKCFPVVNKSPDEIIGAAYLEDIILDMAQPQPLGLRAIMKKAHFVPETMSALKAFESFKHGRENFLFVMDEYGGLAGAISIEALVEEIVGELSSTSANEEPIIQQADGSWLADGTLNIDVAEKTLSLNGLGEECEFHTLAGFVLSLAGELPRVGESFDYEGYKFKVLEKDGNRIDKLLITKVDKTE